MKNSAHYWVTSFLPQNLPKLRNKCLHWINSSCSDITEIISYLDSNKAYGHVILSMQIVNFCRNSACKPLYILFIDLSKAGWISSDWKKLRFHLFISKQCLTNYRPVSLLPIYSKIFERVIDNKMLAFLTQKNLICSNQSRLRPLDSCIYQLIVTHKICESFTDCLQVRLIFLDMSKAFDQAWHAGLYFKLSWNGIP